MRSALDGLAQSCRRGAQGTLAGGARPRDSLARAANWSARR